MSERDPSDNRVVRVGVVGAGQISQMCHIAPLCELPQCRIVALADLRPELAAAAARTWRIPHYYSDHRQLLDRETIDALVVVTNRQANGAIVRQALVDCHAVLSEKPLAHTIEQADVLNACAAKAGVPLAVGYMKRHDAGVQMLKEILTNLLTSGELGSLIAVKAWSCGGDTGRPDTGFAMTPEPRPPGLEIWPTAPAWLDGGAAAGYAAFLNVHVHALNWLRFLLGPLVVNDAMHDPAGGYRIGLTAAQVSVDLICRDGERGHWTEGASITFAGGQLSIALPAPFRDGATAAIGIRAHDPAVEARLAPVRLPPSWAFRRQAAAFIETVRSGAPPLASGASAAADCALAEAIWRRLRA